MDYTGQVKGGVVVFENGTPPEGAQVRVEVIGETSQTESAKPARTIWAKLLELAGTS